MSTSHNKRSRGPSFLGIGPPKTGSSWIYHTLKCHPDVEMPPLKELRFLWARSFLPESRYLSTFVGRHWHFRVQRRFFAARFRGHSRSLLSLRVHPSEIMWDLHYLFMPHSFSWYSRLFSVRKCSGDITPKYCELPEGAIEEVKAHFPEVKIIISARDPVEREWSRAKMNLCRRTNMKVDDVPHDEWLEHFNDPIQSVANDYLSLYHRWTKYFGTDNVFLMFYDDLVADAWDSYCRICDFLGLVGPPESTRQLVERKYNTGIQDEVPPELRTYLIRRHRDGVLELSRAFPSSPHPIAWLESYAAISG